MRRWFSMIAGWALLPNAVYPGAESVFALPVGSGGSMHALAIPTSILVNKATTIGLGCLIGVMLFDWPLVRRVRFRRLDLPIAAWCLVPIASALANGLPLAEGLAQSRYLALAWGVPYLMGRVYLGDNESLRRFGLGLVIAGLAYAPLCLVEFAVGPFLYSAVYGPHPYEFDGADRLIGHRPLGFLEHGNQLGMWVANAAVASVWLWKTRRSPVVLGIPCSGVAAALVVVCLFCQSHSAIALALAACLTLLLIDRSSTSLQHISKRNLWLAFGLLLALGCAGLAVDLQHSGLSGVRGQLRQSFQGMGKASFTWRLARYEQWLPYAATHPILGSGRSDWSSLSGHSFFDPVALGLWLFAFGIYGAVGLACLTALLTLPVVEVVRRLPARVALRETSCAVSLSAMLLALNVLDSLMNSVVLLPVVAAAGGLHSWLADRPDRISAGRGLVPIRVVALE